MSRRITEVRIPRPWREDWRKSWFGMTGTYPPEEIVPHTRVQIDERSCVQCGTRFEARTYNNITCSQACYSERNRQNTKARRRT